MISSAMHLLDRSQLISTGPVDHADWNYKPVIGFIQRMRFRLVLRLLGKRQVGSLLEIGYGSGIFMPELARHTRQLAGIDIHPRHTEVAGVLARCGVTADLRSASMTNIPFPDESFDCAVAVSAMEFVDDIDRACTEIRRVLKPGGEFLVITPGRSPVLDFGLWLLTHESAKDDFAGRRERVRPALEKHFDRGGELRSPVIAHHLVCLYRGFRMLRPAKEAAPAQSIRQDDNALSVRT